MSERICIDCGVIVRPHQRLRCPACVVIEDRRQARERGRRVYVPKPAYTVVAVCIDCGLTWEHPSGKRYSPRCAPCRVAHKARERKVFDAKKRKVFLAMACVVCGTEFTPRTKSSLYCSRTCQYRSRVLTGEQKAAARRWGLKAKWGMTPDGFERMLASQGGLCANKGCGATTAGGRFNQWNIDHDHACCDSGKTCGRCVRGLLCNRCNRAAGQMADNAEALRGLADYIESHRTIT